MAKIGTAHIEIKPVLDVEALGDLCKRIEDAVAAGVERGMQRGSAINIDPGSLMSSDDVKAFVRRGLV